MTNPLANDKGFPVIGSPFQVLVGLVQRLDALPSDHRRLVLEWLIAKYKFDLPARYRLTTPVPVGGTDQ